MKLRSAVAALASRAIAKNNVRTKSWKMNHQKHWHIASYMGIGARADNLFFFSSL